MPSIEETRELEWLYACYTLVDTHQSRLEQDRKSLADVERQLKKGKLPHTWVKLRMEASTHRSNIENSVEDTFPRARAELARLIERDDLIDDVDGLLDAADRVIAFRQAEHDAAETAERATVVTERAAVLAPQEAAPSLSDSLAPRRRNAPH